MTGEDADVQAAKELYKDQSVNVTEYPFKAVNNPIAMLDENGEQMVRDGEPVFIDDIYLILSKSTTKENKIQEAAERPHERTCPEGQPACVRFFRYKDS